MMKILFCHFVNIVVFVPFQAKLSLIFEGKAKILP